MVGSTCTAERQSVNVIQNGTTKRTTDCYILHTKTSQRVTNVNIIIISWCLLRQTNSTNCCLSMKFCSYNKGATSSGALLHFLHYLGECVSKWFKTAHLGHPLLLKIHVCVGDHPVSTCPTMLQRLIEVCSSGKHVV